MARTRSHIQKLNLHYPKFINKIQFNEIHFYKEEEGEA